MSGKSLNIEDLITYAKDTFGVTVRVEEQPGKDVFKEIFGDIVSNEDEYTDNTKNDNENPEG